MELAARTTSFVVFVILSFAQEAPISEAATLNVGVILNLQSLVGKMARTSILMAMEDFYAVHRNYTTKLVLHIRDSSADSVQAYTESGVAMIVQVKDDTNKNTWVFLKPLTTDLWLGSIAFFIYTGIVIWLLERRINNAELTGSFFRQLGIAIYFSFFADSE